MTEPHITDDEASPMPQHEATARILELEQAWEAPTGEMPERVPLATLEVIEELFQPRTMSEKHLQDLKKAIKAVGPLDPLVVLPVGTRLIVLDGHHRRQAYQMSGFTELVPVSYFKGSPREAMFEAVRQNAKAKLPMEGHEKKNFAWKLVLVGESSKAEISKAAGVSTGLVATMRRTRTLLKESAFEHHSWYRAQRAAKGTGQLEVDIDEWKEQQANAWADKMAKEFTTTMSKNPEVAAMALSIYFGRKLPALYQELRTFIAEDAEFDEWDRADF